MNMKEIMPLYKNIIIDIYDENPYKSSKTEEGLDLTETFVNSDSGQVEEKKLFIECAKVIEAGPDCEFIKNEMDVIVDVRSISPIIFCGKCYWLVNEQAIKAAIGEDLKNEFTKNK